MLPTIILLWSVPCDAPFTYITTLGIKIQANTRPIPSAPNARYPGTHQRCYAFGPARIR